MLFGEEIAPDTTYRTAALKYGVGDNVRQKFTGYERDEETGLDFAEARYYYNNHGRFTAVDPLLASGKSANPQTFNRYAYTMNRPLILTDSSGLQAGEKPDQKVKVTVSRVPVPKIQTYNVRGADDVAAWKDAESKGPTNYAAEYSFDVRFTATFSPTSVKEVEGEFEVSVSTSSIRVNIENPTITLPTWENQKGASQQDQREWNEERARLRSHENEHHELAAKDVNEIIKPALETISAPITATARGKTATEARDAAIQNASAKISAVFDPALEKVREKQAQFDLETNRGKKPIQ